MKKENFLQNNVFSRLTWDIAAKGKRPGYYTERERERERNIHQSPIIHAHKWVLSHNT